jgi:hypothetical protein
MPGLKTPMPRTEDAAGKCVSSNATVCNHCCKALQKPLVCAQCTTAAYCSKDCQVHTPHWDRAGLGSKTVID